MEAVLEGWSEQKTCKIQLSARLVSLVRIIILAWPVQGGMLPLTAHAQFCPPSFPPHKIVHPVRPSSPGLMEADRV
jgi:hypothetical protein